MKTILIIFLLIFPFVGFAQTTNNTSYKWTGTKNSFTQPLIAPLPIPNGTATNHAVNLGQMNTALSGKQNILVNPLTKGDSVWIKDLIKRNQSQQADISRLEAMILKIEAQLNDTISLKKALIDLLNK
jgi:hypothetical protein